MTRDLTAREITRSFGIKVHTELQGYAATATAVSQSKQRSGVPRKCEVSVYFGLFWYIPTSSNFFYLLVLSHQLSFVLLANGYWPFHRWAARALTAKLAGPTSCDWQKAELHWSSNEQKHTKAEFIAVKTDTQLFTQYGSSFC